MKKKVTYFVFFTLIVFGFYLVIDHNVKNNTKTYIYLKNQVPFKIKNEIRETIKSFTKYFDKDNLVLEKINDVQNNKLGIIRSYNNKFFNFTGPRAYLGSNEDSLFLITGSGLLYHSNLSNFDKDKNVDLKKIETNILEIFKNYRYDDSDELEEVTMVKSILVHENIMYFSATVKMSENCYKQKIFKSELNLDKMNFDEFFQIKDCRTFYNNTSGGNIVLFGNNKILYTLGDWKSCQYLEKYPKNFCIENGPQKLDSSLGKIVEISISDKKFKYISTGHNNPQGITFSEERNTIFSAEHGPQGGDEVNINDLSDGKEEIKNFGWPQASYGEHYGHPSDDIKYLYEMAPLLKSHKKNGFIEPLDYFVPSIGISDIEYFEDKLFVGSMGDNVDQGDLTLYIYEIDNQNNIKSKNSVLLNQRIRDLHIINEKLFMFLESTGTISIVNLKDLKLS